MKEFDDSPNPEFVVIGELLTDVVARTAQQLRYGSDTRATISTHGGGGGANTAAWLATGGATVGFVARVGDDALGRAATLELLEAGVELHVPIDPVAATGTCVVIVGPDGERTMLPDAGANANLVPSDLPDQFFRPGAHLHLSGYSLLTPSSRLAGLAALDLARIRRMTISVDPASSGPLLDIGPDRFLDWIGGVGLLLANEAEACALTGATDPLAAGQVLADQFPDVIVKLGSEGAAWFKAKTEPVFSPALALSVVDTTGAGDAFAAGLLATWHSGANVATTLAVANRTAALAVSRVGARP
ncbi:MAG: sugar kinase [Actinomycetes bacterium]